MKKSFLLFVMLVAQGTYLIGSLPANSTDDLEAHLIFMIKKLKPVPSLAREVALVKTLEKSVAIWPASIKAQVMLNQSPKRVDTPAPAQMIPGLPELYPLESTN